MLDATGVSLSVAAAVWAEIKSAGRASDEHLSILETLFGKNMLRACKIVDERGARQRPLALPGDGGVEEEGGVPLLPRASLHALLLFLRHRWARRAALL